MFHFVQPDDNELQF